MSVADGSPLRGTDWDPLLRQEFEKPYWADLQAFLLAERFRYSVYPPHEEVFLRCISRRAPRRRW